MRLTKFLIGIYYGYKLGFRVYGQLYYTEHTTKLKRYLPLYLRTFVDATVTVAT